MAVASAAYVFLSIALMMVFGKLWQCESFEFCFGTQLYCGALARGCVFLRLQGFSPAHYAALVVVLCICEGRVFFVFLSAILRLDLQRQSKLCMFTRNLKPPLLLCS